MFVGRDVPDGGGRCETPMQSPEKPRLHGCEPEENFLNSMPRMRKILPHLNEVFWHEKNGGTK